MKEIILGTVQFGLDYGINNKAGKPTEENVFEILNCAYANGIRTLDTAEGYGDAVELIGRFHQATGRFFSINTKFAGQGDRSIEELVNESVDRLGVQCIDTCFFHGFGEYSTNRQAMDALVDLKNRKRILQVGVSVYGDDEFEAAMNDEQVDVIQFPFNLLDNYARRGKLMSAAKHKGKVLQARSVFLQGLFFKEVEEMPTQLKPLVPLVRQLGGIAASHALSMEDLCMQYAVSYDEIDAVLIGVDDVQQLQRNLAAARHTGKGSLLDEINSIRVADPSLLFPYNWKK